MYTLKKILINVLFLIAKSMNVSCWICLHFRNDHDSHAWHDGASNGSERPSRIRNALSYDGKRHQTDASNDNDDGLRAYCTTTIFMLVNKPTSSLSALHTIYTHSNLT